MGREHARQLDLAKYRKLAAVTTAGICVLVVAGGVVRLTGSGLGCEDWPNCNDTRFIDVSAGHTAIEQINRILSGLIGIPTLMLAVGSFFVRGRSGLRWPALGVLATVLGNGIVGGLAVRGDLHPALVQSHFLLAMVSISFGVIAFRRSGPTPITFSARDPWILALTALTGAALVTGTVVTGTGPHAGEEDVRRFGFDITRVAQVHSVTVLITIGVSLFIAWRMRSSPASWISTLSAWMFIAFIQGAVGYIQYFNDVPEILVGMHLALATALWVTTMWLAVSVSSQTGGDDVVASPESGRRPVAPVA